MKIKSIILGIILTVSLSVIGCQRNTENDNKTNTEPKKESKVSLEDYVISQGDYIIDIFERQDYTNEYEKTFKEDYKSSDENSNKLNAIETLNNHSIELGGIDVIEHLKFIYEQSSDKEDLNAMNLTDFDIYKISIFDYISDNIDPDMIANPDELTTKEPVKEKEPIKKQEPTKEVNQQKEEDNRVCPCCGIRICEYCGTDLVNEAHCDCAVSALEMNCPGCGEYNPDYNYAPRHAECMLCGICGSVHGADGCTGSE